MTDSEKLDLLLEKVVVLDQKVSGHDQKFISLDQKVTRLEIDMAEVKTDLKHLHWDDAMILDEVERVHKILDRHKSDRSVHTA